MNMKTKTLYVVNPGLVPSITFVTCYETDEVGDRAELGGGTPDERRESTKRSWTQAITHLPKVFDRLVRQSLKRPAFKARAAA